LRHRWGGVSANGEHTAERKTYMPFADSSGVKIYYDDYGTGTPIVFLHPFTANAGIWYFQVFSFAPTNRCIAIDLRGHGRSDKPEGGYSIPKMTNDVAAVMDTAGVERAVMVGSSIGGKIALQLNLDHPERVLGNVLLSCGTASFKTMPQGPNDLVTGVS
jgi:pimeloyl-ACP methyl ester carboxylesterase